MNRYNIITFLKRLIHRKKLHLTWYDITLEQYLKLAETVNIEDKTEQALAICELIFGGDLTLQEFNEKMKELEFLNTEIPNPTPPKTLNINGRKYFTDCLLGNIKTSQYIDFMNYLKTNNIVGILSVFLIPEGHTYNDGYDLLRVMNDAKELQVPVAMGISFFFKRQLNKFTEIFQSYSIKKLKRLKVKKNLKEALVKIIQGLKLLV